MISPFLIIGALGLVLVILGIFFKEKKQNILFIIGGILLLVYSIWLKIIIFIILQAAFTLAAVYDLIKSYFRV